MKRAELAGFALYNLRDDIGEAHGFASEQPDRVKAMRETMSKLYHEVRDAWTPWQEWPFANYDGPRIKRAVWWKVWKHVAPAKQCRVGCPQPRRVLRQRTLHGLARGLQ